MLRLLSRTPKLTIVAAACGTGSSLSLCLGSSQSSTTTTTTTTTNGVVETTFGVSQESTQLVKNVQDKDLYDLRADLLERGRATPGSTSDLAQKASSKVVTDGMHKGQTYVYRVVLTGGPCGGKSSTLRAVTAKLTSMGFDIYCVPEVPTIMMNGGCRFPGMSSKLMLMEFESALLKMQLQAERTFLQVASSTKRPAVVIMDRGVKDIKAYMPPDLWQELVERHGLTEDYIDARYDLVLHLVTAADGAEKFYTKANNAARTETPEQAIALDKLIANAYADQKSTGTLAYIDNSTDFNGKLERAVAAIVKMIESNQ